MPTHYRDPRTLRGVRPGTLAVRPDYTVHPGPADLDISGTRVRSTGYWLLLSEESLAHYLRFPGFPRNLWEIYYGQYAYRFNSWAEAMAAAEHVVSAAASREAQRQESRERHLEFQASLPKEPRRWTSKQEFSQRPSRGANP